MKATVNPLSTGGPVSCIELEAPPRFPPGNPAPWQAGTSSIFHAVKSSVGRWWNIWRFPEMEVHSNGGFILGNTIYKWMIWGYPYFRKPPCGVVGNIIRTRCWDFQQAWLPEEGVYPRECMRSPKFVFSTWTWQDPNSKFSGVIHDVTSESRGSEHPECSIWSWFLI